MMTKITVWAVAAYMLAAQDGTWTSFSIRHSPEFLKPEGVLQELVNAKAKQRINHFCIIGYRSAENDSHAWVWWREGSALILWEPSVRPTTRQRSNVQQRVNSRSKSFAEAWAEVFCADKFGQATTHWSKLADRVARGVGNPCPLVLIGIPDSVIGF